MPLCWYRGNDCAQSCNKRREWETAVWSICFTFTILSSKEKLKTFEERLVEERKKRLEERKKQRKEDRRNAYYRQKEEEAQRIHEEQLKKGN